MKRRGIICAGNFIVDHLRLVEMWPEQDMLTSITSEMVSNGGGPFNVLKDLSAMRADFPLEAAGCVGRDADGGWILNECVEAGINTAQLHQVEGEPTSYTEVICVTSTGRRTFFHRRGANSVFDLQHVDFGLTQASHFHLAYLMLLDALDARNSDNGRTRASLLLERALVAGLSTSVDLVSLEHPDFKQKVVSALPYVDHLFVNEREAELVTGVKISAGEEISIDAACEAARILLGFGVRRQVILHDRSGAIVCEASGIIRCEAHEIPKNQIAGANGAGDAFAAGYLFGLQEGWEISECLRMATSVAAACLTHASPSGGLLPARDCLARNPSITLKTLR